ncbi:hypothetical protein [Anabaena sp. CCY 0017]|uniref:hypothetical protein n=1 Tax=Anabaena sp. CCY 0017 TaxID=3103866 RepID=UPI0039C608D8
MYIKHIENKTITLKRQKKIKLPDAIIAATAICQEAILLTRNVDDFKGFPELLLENPFCDYSGSRLSEIQEPHPQPPPRKRGGGYDVFHSSAYRYNKASY